MDGRAQLQSLARAIGSASEIEAAWVGNGSPVDVRKACGICGEDQPVRVPFLRHVCRSCQAIWVPGICGDCAHTSVTFTLDGQLSRSATCGCGGTLRQVAYVPKPRVAVDPEVAAARKVVVERRKKRAGWTSRAVLLVITALAAWGSTALVQRNHSGPPPAAVPARAPVDSASLTPEQRGRVAAQRLLDNGQAHDAFGCASLLPPAAAALPGDTASVPTAHEGLDAAGERFLAACIRG